MRLETNGRLSGTKRTKHLHSRYFFVTDKIQSNKLTVEYCPTEIMWADEHTKPKQGLKFYTNRAFMMNCPIDYNNVAARTLVLPKLLHYKDKENSPPIDRTKPVFVRRSVLNKACPSKISSNSEQRNLRPAQRAPLRGNHYRIQTPRQEPNGSDSKSLNFS
ncbi:hypothetical protein ACHAWF_010851 [Thalassiosira exigua]